MLEALLLVTIVIIIILSYLSYVLHNRNRQLRQLVTETVSQKQSLSTKYGKMSEQFFPFLEEYPYNYQNFRFIGTPIDGIQFEDNSIIFVEFKSSKSKLTARQRSVKNLVEQGKIRFEEFRIDIDKNKGSSQ